MLLHADSEDSDQTGRMSRLIWVFAGRTAILLVLSCRGSYTLGPKYPRYMYTRTYKQYTHVYWVQEIHERINLKDTFRVYMLIRKKKCFCFVLKKIFWLSDCEKKSPDHLPPPPSPPRKSNGRSLNRFSRDVAHMVSCYFLDYFHCNK